MGRTKFDEARKRDSKNLRTFFLLKRGASWEPNNYWTIVMEKAAYWCGPWFSNVHVHTSLMGILLKCCFDSGGYGPRACASNKILGDAGAAGRGHTLSSEGPKYRWGIYLRRREISSHDWKGMEFRMGEGEFGRWEVQAKQCVGCQAHGGGEALGDKVCRFQGVTVPAWLSSDHQGFNNWPSPEL